MKKIKFPKLQKRKIKKKWIIGGIIVLLVIIAGACFFVTRPGMNNVRTSTKMNTAVTTGTIRTSVSGTGTISYASTTDIVLPSDLNVDEVLISEGSNVAAGDLIATVDEASLAFCLNEVEDAIAEVDDTISSESSSSTSQSIKAGVAGRVKKIYADEDDSVVDIMQEKGALMLLSADDLMMVTLEGVTSLAVGDEVVVSSGDTTTDGTVESVSDSGTVITFDDSVFAYEEEVTVIDSEETTLGTGTAYIHQMIQVVGSGGIISSLNVSLNSEISATTKVFTLNSDAKSAEYLQAVKEREQLVEMLNTLISIQANGGIVASVDGMLQTVNVSADSSSSSNGQSSNGGFVMGTSNESVSKENVEIAQSAATEVATLVASKDINMLSVNENVEETTSAMQLSAMNAVVNLGTVEEAKTPAEAPTNLTGGAGVINGTTVYMEYADKEDATEWKECTDEKTEVAAGTWYVRMKETDTLAASVAVKVEVTAAKIPQDDVQQNTNQSTGDIQQNSESTQQNTNDLQNNAENANKEKTAAAPESDNAESRDNKENNGKTSSGSGVSVSKSGSVSSISSATTSATTSSSLETTSMFTIANGDKMMVTMYVDELDIGTMQAGQEAEITLDAIEGEIFTGEITGVSGNASTSGGSSQYPVEITFDKTDAMLSGMNASVEVIVEQAENVLVVPLIAIQDEGSISYVYTNYDEAEDKLSGKVQVELGLSDETNVEITTGLTEGDTVYYEMQGSKDSTTGNSGMGRFTMPGGMNGMPSGGGFPGGGDMPGGNMSGGRQNGGNSGQRGRMGGQ